MRRAYMLCADGAERSAVGNGMRQWLTWPVSQRKQHLRNRMQAGPTPAWRWSLRMQRRIRLD